MREWLLPLAVKVALGVLVTVSVGLMVLETVLLAPALSDIPEATPSGTAGSVMLRPVMSAVPVFFRLYVSFTESPALTVVLLMERVKVRETFSSSRATWKGTRLEPLWLSEDQSTTT